MFPLHPESPIKRRLVEPVLAVLAILLTAGTINESAILYETALGRLWYPAVILVPGLLSLSVLVGGVAHGIRLGFAVLGSGDRIRPGDAALTRILASFVLGALAVYTLLWVVATLYVHHLAETGGVSPTIFVLMFGGVLGALVLVRAVFFQLFPEGPLSRLNGLFVE
ncbi:hypothetical protein [Natrinema salsiterrestre]|uniref:Uncharacterized protein n=1 Tax=Natrinema salsiterrestre TaxID=2950540 RepID=A0A9Q4L6H0_9EURY|nr:hypothetical protein [Natrinema salsiterrestre]MDF9746171.1 hypothetical protein [Natrinema salsiterrestre]